MSKKEEQALRVFEALNQVDEDLLLRSEKITEKKNGKVILFRRLNKVAAACIMLFVAGGVFVVAQSVRLSAAKSAPSGISNFALGLKAENVEHDGCAPMEAKTNYSYASDRGVSEAEEEKNMLPEKESAVTEANGKNESIREEALDKTETPNLEVDGTIITYQRQSVTLEQVKSTALGKYLPKQIAKGYEFEGAYVLSDSDTEEIKSITACWSKGMDDIRITVKLPEREAVALVDVTDLASYDVNLYEIPYADSVPAEYYNSFHNPVFAAKDMSLEIVNRRMKTVQDAGDTATPRGNLGIWFKDEGVLIEFNCKAEPEAVWSMIESSCEGN